MTLPVLVTQGAQDDLSDIYSYIASHDSEAMADKILDGIQAVLQKLARFPLRGEYPPELVTLGIRDFRQAHFKPYRMIYQVGAEAIYVLVIADGRRDLQTLLQRRLLRS